MLLAASGAIVYWHLPGSWDAAVLNPLVHAAEHLTFLLVGLAIGSFMQALSDSAKITALLAAFFGHMGYAAILVAPWNVQVYPLYSVSDQAVLGWSLLLTGWVFLVGVAYIIRGNPAWLQGFSGKAVKQGGESPGTTRRKWRDRAVPAVSISLILILVVYFAATSAALASAGGSPPAGAVVYIVETPISWQYSPQNVVVVIGLNNSVTWVSRSTSYDTITSDAGLFDSGPIQPGGSFSHIFSAPGVYAYHCAFHPWMTGRITVLPKQ
jgi:plastocyanin